MATNLRAALSEQDFENICKEYDEIGEEITDWLQRAKHLKNCDRQTYLDCLTHAKNLPRPQERTCSVCHCLAEIKEESEMPALDAFLENSQHTSSTARSKLAIGLAVIDAKRKDIKAREAEAMRQQLRNKLQEALAAKETTSAASRQKNSAPCCKTWKVWFRVAKSIYVR